jgi:hypothetical protein
LRKAGSHLSSRIIQAGDKIFAPRGKPLRTKSPALSRFFVFVLILALLTTAGCLGPKGEETAISADEEVYIDLKLGFSVVVPVSWLRQKLPVSAPGYKSDTVEWEIPGPVKDKNTLRIKALEHLKLPITPESLNNLIPPHTEGITKPPLNFEHPAGQALRVEWRRQAQRLISLIIVGPDRSYLLSITLDETEYDQFLPAVEKTLLSFSILGD